MKQELKVQIAAIDDLARRVPSFLRTRIRAKRNAAFRPARSGGGEAKIAPPGESKHSSGRQSGADIGAPKSIGGFFWNECKRIGKYLWPTFRR